jgi:glutathione S-transferase
MLKLYSYPTLFGVADNNGYGLKVFAFLKLAGVPFQHEHVFDASAAPRKQLPYIVDGHDTIGDSETILAYVTQKYRVGIDASLTLAQRTTNLLITRMLDDLYWVMSYSRWKDERYWKAFHDALLREHPHLTKKAWPKRRRIIRSAIIIRASAVTIPMRLWHEGSLIWRCLLVSSPARLLTW